MKLSTKIKEQKELIADLSDIINACISVIANTGNQIDYEFAKKDLVITYEERERQYKHLENMVRG
jgi:hypothetical protein